MTVKTNLAILIGVAIHVKTYCLYAGEPWGLGLNIQKRVSKSLIIWPLRWNFFIYIRNWWYISRYSTYWGLSCDPLDLLGCYDYFTYFSPLIFLVYSLHAPTSCLLFLVYILISFYRLSFLSCAALLFMCSLMHSMITHAQFCGSNIWGK